jgi:glucose/mannose-6-phosphate isomerase
MDQYIEKFAEQLKRGLEIGESAKLTHTGFPIDNVLISGLGGSGIGGSIAAQILEQESSVPVYVNNKYFLPAYVGKNTLVIISSYSGNTEETLSCLHEAIKREAKIVCVTSGGLIGQIAKENKIDHIIIPGGMPPRTCLGYSMIQLFYILSFFKIIKDGFKDAFIASINLITDEKSHILLEAKAIAAKLLNKLPIIYSTSSNEAVCVRFRQQLNENSKVLAWHHVFPEMNHNELVGWTQKNEDLAVIILRSENDFERNNFRIEFSKKIFSQHTSTLIEIFSKGKSKIENAIYLIHICDWISYFLAELRGVDAIEVNVISRLKNALAEKNINPN